MGGALGKAADDIGGFLGNAVTAPFKTVLGRSCKDVCSGPWDVECFIEHFCIPDLIKLVMISALCFIITMFLYLLFKLGICQCIVKSLCKMCFAACEMYWCTISDIIYFFWHKLKHTKRVNRRRKRIHDIEAAVYSSSREGNPSDSYDGRSFSRKRSRERMVRRRSTRRRSSGRHYGHVRGMSSRKVGSSRKVQFSKGRTSERKVKSFKKRRLG